MHQKVNAGNSTSIVLVLAILFEPLMSTALPRALTRDLHSQLPPVDQLIGNPRLAAFFPHRKYRLSFLVYFCHNNLAPSNQMQSVLSACLRSRVLNNNSMQAFALLLLHINGLDIAVELLLGAFLVVALSADAHAQAERHAFDAGLPDFLV